MEETSELERTSASPGFTQVNVGENDGPESGDHDHRGTFPECNFRNVFTGLIFTRPEERPERRHRERFTEVKSSVGCCYWRLAPISISAFNSLLWTNSEDLSKASDQTNQGKEHSKLTKIYRMIMQKHGREVFHL